MILTTEDVYGGVIVEPSYLSISTEQFREELLALIDSSTHKKLLWVKVPIEKSELIPLLTNLGFEFHHCEEHSLMLILKLSQNSLVPTTKNYIVGVGAIVMRDGLLLVVKDRFSVGYKLPGGHIDKNEALKDALKREVYEETGIDVEFESIMNLGHFINGQFGESNIYIVCTAIARTSVVVINDASEIIDAKWMPVEDFLNLEEVNNYNKSVVKAVLQNPTLKLTDQKIKLRVTTGEVFF